MSELGVRLRVFDLESCIHTLEPHSVGAELPFLYHFFSRARLDQVSGLEHYPVHNASPGGRLNHSAVFFDGPAGYLAFVPELTMFLF